MKPYIFFLALLLAAMAVRGDSNWGPFNPGGSSGSGIDTNYITTKSDVSTWATTWTYSSGHWAEPNNIYWLMPNGNLTNTSAHILQLTNSAGLPVGRSFGTTLGDG
ncbi:MAG: hypothetical protein KGL39_34130, partial [Patescibacteria group bacterium]|nr:hypothetical protein [Patescibacteria group bacterium]